jgi:probable rRNA maturation factor
MILLDPDLDAELPHRQRPVRGGPAPAPKKTSAKQIPVSNPLVPDKNQRLPSARTLARFLALAQAAVRLKGEVTVQLTTDTAIRRLNRQFRHKDKATDVLSFPAGGVGAEEIAGDLAISVPTALRQAVGQGHSLLTEIKVLILHGLLHLAGYDHEADTGQMARRERLLRARLGLPQGLIERAAQPGPSARKSATKAPKTAVLKGHGFSRAANSPRRRVALAAEGMQMAEKSRVPQVSPLRPGKPRTNRGLKP